MADDVIGICRDEGIREAIFAGCSVGSGIAMLIGLDQPEMCKAIILVGGGSGGGRDRQKRIQGYTTGDFEKYHLEHLRSLVTPEFWQSRLGGYLLSTFTERDPWLSGGCIAEIFRARAGTDMTPRLSSMRVPTLVINGEHDGSLPGGTKTAQLIPGAVHKILPRTGHACCIEDPGGFDALVIEFLQARNLMR